MKKIEQVNEPKLRSDRVTLTDGRYLIFYSFDTLPEVERDNVPVKPKPVEESNQRE